MKPRIWIGICLGLIILLTLTIWKIFTSFEVTTPEITSHDANWGDSISTIAPFLITDCSISSEGKSLKEIDLEIQLHINLLKHELCIM